MDDSKRTHPLDSLTTEHRVIRMVMDALEVFCERLETNEPADLRDLERFATFFADFAEATHHVKEEDILLRAMVKKGFAWDQGPVARVRADHAQERYLVRVLKQAALQQSPWNEEARRHAIASIRALVDFQRRHMQREEDILYPAASQRLSPAELGEIDASLRHFDEAHASERDLDAHLETARAMSAKYAGASQR